MQYYELATLTVPVGFVSATGDNVRRAAEAIDAFAANAPGRLLGSWVGQFGPQNKIVALRAFDTRNELEDERERVLMSIDPYGVGDSITHISLESYAQFPGLSPVQPADFGPVYEFRTYCLRVGCLAPVIEGWTASLPARTALSPAVTVMYALDGKPRFTHIWAYKSFEARNAVRAEASKKGIWPVKGAADHLDQEMKSEIFSPTPASRLK